METTQHKSVRKQPAQQYEAPLRSFGPEEPAKPFAECQTVFSVDVSGSTSGKVLNEEIRVTQKAVSCLTETSKTNSRVIPWDTDAHEIITVNELHRLDSAGGTNPNSMLRSREHLEVLRKAELWFLLTDGEIDEEDVEVFASELGTAGLHNKACVLVLFGYQHRPPLLANLSVGISVYASFPDCIYLFHDVVEGGVYVLSVKGCFRDLVGKAFRNPVIDERTRWRDLATFDYLSLGNLQIPPQQMLKPSEVLLQDRRQIDLDSVFAGKLSAEETKAIFSDEQNINSVLLTASTRGKQEHVTNWLLKQRESRQHINIRTLERKDLHHQAENLMSKVIESCLEGNFTDRRCDAYQSALRKAHHDNWLAFAQDVESARSSHDPHNAMLELAFEKMKLVRSHGVGSPSCLSPGMSRASFKPPTGASSSTAVDLPTRERSPIRQDWPKSISHEISNVHRLPKSLPANVSTLRNQIPFISGFLIDSTATLPTESCPFCGELSASWAIMLKSPPAEIQTPDFALPNSYSEIRYPLAMAGFPETDIVSMCVCCDSCACAMVQHGTSPINEKVIAALPVNISLLDEENERAWLEAIGAALQHRFSEQDLHAVLVGLLNENVCRWSQSASTSIHLFKEATVQIIRKLELRMTLISESNVRMSVQEAARSIVQTGLFPSPIFGTRKTIAFSVAKFLEHPMESFVTILRYVPQAFNRLSLLFMRFFWQIVEEINSLSLENRRPVQKYLLALEPQPKKSTATWGLREYYHKLDLQELVQQNIVQHWTLTVFEQETGTWQDFNERCHPALHVCLWRYARSCSSATPKQAADIFGAWLEFPEFVELCEKPDEQVRVVRWAYSTSGLDRPPALRLGAFANLNKDVEDLPGTITGQLLDPVPRDEPEDESFSMHIKTQQDTTMQDVVDNAQQPATVLT